ncbi:hypothetical protein PBAC_08090 [Pedobacter glucosidilyticus]|uniref:Uncharacterized protein n=1 Tax=Pedobacter aquae TaxID=2605747 RepID=A0A5C0VJ74_9SPHI|nr:MULTISPECIES: hypothetical protein [Pedobacter]KHJ38946.1 hypothetical protein PBAC_08090 [Pedobacter glucosidilyticus]QEK51882.1 hypothetical protein FYC62_09660 [Pedobacter aquae]
MLENEIKLWQILIPSLSGIIGVLIGSLIGVFANDKLKKRESQLRILEKVFDTRLKAYESVLEMIKSLRVTVSSYSIDIDGNLITYPLILDNKYMLEEFHSKFYSNSNTNSHWLDLDVVHELYYIQDYLANLTGCLREIDEKHYPEIGKIIKQDFIDMSTKVENKLLTFFDKDIYTINLKTKKGHHKLPREVTIKRLDGSLLFINKDIICSFKNINQ